MNAIQLSGIDLNLLVTLSVLLDTESVTETGRRLGRTPSAISHALGRLRQLLDDPLFVRAGQRLRPTPSAAALHAPLQAWLDATAGLLQAQPFQPATASRRFRVIASGYLQQVVIPPLMTTLRTTAPGVNLWIQPIQGSVTAALTEGDADLALGVSISAPPLLRSRLLCRDRFVSVSRKELCSHAMDVQAWASLPHILVAPGQQAGGPVDHALAQLGLRRRIAVTLPDFLIATELVAKTDLVVTLPERLARVLAADTLHIAPPPLTLPPLTLLALWHQRLHTDPAHQWFRGLVAAAAQDA